MLYLPSFSRWQGQDIDYPTIEFPNTERSNSEFMGKPNALRAESAIRLMTPSEL